MDKKTFLILGGYGQTGRLIAELLLQETDVQLILAARTLAKVQATADILNQKFDGNRVSTQRVDAADFDNLKEAFKKIDFVVVTSSALNCTENVAKAALATGIGYFDSQMPTAERTKLFKSMRDDFKQAGCCFITEGGVIPGIPAMLIRYAATKLDRLEIAYIASIMRDTDVPLSTETLTEFNRVVKTYQPLIFKGGKWNITGTKQFDFGIPFGIQNCRAWYLDELGVMSNTIGSLKEFGFFMGGFGGKWFIKYIFTPLSSVLPKTSLTDKVLGKMFTLTFNRPPYATVKMLEAKGWKDNKYVNMRIRLTHRSSYFLTAVPAVACLLQYLSGDIGPGLWYQANVVEPKRMMSDIERLGINIEVQYDEIMK